MSASLPTAERLTHAWMEVVKRDTEQENNGLLTAAREPKFDPALIRAILTQHSASVPSEKLDVVQ